jgi:hypothetical protein
MDNNNLTGFASENASRRSAATRFVKVDVRGIVIAL